jgi:hypothetical protein
LGDGHVGKTLFVYGPFDRVHTWDFKDILYSGAVGYASVGNAPVESYVAFGFLAGCGKTFSPCVNMGGAIDKAIE